MTPAEIERLKRRIAALEVVIQRFVDKGDAAMVAYLTAHRDALVDKLSAQS